MTYDQALDFIYDVSLKGRKKGLSRIRELLFRMGDPQKKLRYVHVAGTNGKGSTCAMIEKILRTAGYKTGLYTSPHLLRFNERVRVNGLEITDEDLIRYTEDIVGIVESMEERPSFFEIATAVMFRYFADAGCDIVVLETGLGGRLDATNIIDAPEVSVITTIDFDHTADLGDTRELIAREKAGIIKHGRPVVVGTEDPEALGSILQKAEEEGSTVHRAPEKPEFLGICGKRQRFLYKGTEYETGLLGRHQLMNAVTAIETVEVLRELGYGISDRDIQEGITQTVWKGRFQPIPEKNIVIDGAHNPEGSRSAAEALADYSSEKPVVIYGCLADKDWQTMIDIIAPCGEEFFLSPIKENPRAIDPAVPAAYLTDKGYKAVCCGSVEEALEKSGARAEELGTFVFCAGSLYLATEALEVLGETNSQI